MARELDAILDHGEANRAASCITESGSVSFLENIICPIYESMAMVSGSLSYSYGFDVYHINRSTIMKTWVVMSSIEVNT